MQAETLRADVRHGAAWSAGQRLKNDLIHAAARAALALARRLPRRLVGWCASALALVAYVTLKRERRRSRARLAAGLGRAVTSAEVRASFGGVGELLADAVAMMDPAERAGRTMTLDEASRAVFSDALAEGRGVVFLTAHLGPWERMAALLVEEGFPVATVARESYDPRFTALYEELRRPRGVRAIYRGRPGAATAIVRELRAGRAVGFLMDLPGRVPCAPVRVWGEDAAWPIGPARIALRRNAAVVVGVPVRAAPGAWGLRIVRLDAPDERSLLQGAAAEIERHLESGGYRHWLGLFHPGKNR